MKLPSRSNGTSVKSAGSMLSADVGFRNRAAAAADMRSEQLLWAARRIPRQRDVPNRAFPLRRPALDSPSSFFFLTPPLPRISTLLYLGNLDASADFPCTVAV